MSLLNRLFGMAIPKGFYTISVVCSNCYKIQFVLIKKGITVKTKLLTAVCNNCGCGKLIPQSAVTTYY